MAERRAGLASRTNHVGSFVNRLSTVSQHIDFLPFLNLNNAVDIQHCGLLESQPCKDAELALDAILPEPLQSQS